MTSKTNVLQPFVQRNAFKVISGLKNLNQNVVLDVAWAASSGGASHVDIACDPALVQSVKRICTIPVCVSAVDPALFVDAVAAGADMVEIGNFDGFYDQGLIFTAEDVIKLTLKTRELLPTVPLSVTIPYHLNLPDQISLAQRLEECGADILQTEGKMGASPVGMGVRELIQLAAPTLASAYALSRAVKIPVMCASGLSDVTAPLAIAAGAAGVGVGSVINKLVGRQQMLLAVQAIASALGRETNGAAMSSADPMVHVASAIDSSVSRQKSRSAFM
jgi:hypothetical protein